MKTLLFFAFISCALAVSPSPSPRILPSPQPLPSPSPMNVVQRMSQLKQYAQGLATQRKMDDQQVSNLRWAQDQSISQQMSQLKALLPSPSPSPLK